MTMELETPKNRKQIGMPDKKNKIFIEDYVVTYLKQNAADESRKTGVAWLFGSCREVLGCREFYIYAAAFEEEEGGLLSRECVQKIMRQRAESFEDYFFLGWCVIHGEEQGAVWENYYRSHMESLFGRPELLITMEKGTLEEHFYTYPTDMPKEAEGYFIFYEQNERMQNFMVDAHWKEDVVRASEPDDVARSCREFYKEKRARKARGRMAIVGCALFIVLMIFAFGSRMSRAIENDATFAQGSETEAVAIAEEGIEQETEADVTPDSEPDEPSGSDGIKGEEGAADAAQVTEEALTDVSSSEEEGVVALSVQEPELPEEDAVQETELPENDATQETEKEAPEEEETDEEQCATYVVSKGDTLYGICISFYGDAELLEEVCRINRIEDKNNILCGQKILLPRQNM